MSDLEFFLLSAIGIIIYIIIGNTVYQIFKISHYKIMLPENRKGFPSYLDMLNQCDESVKTSYYVDKTASYFWPVTAIIYIASAIAQTLFQGIIIKD